MEILKAIYNWFFPAVPPTDAESVLSFLNDLQQKEKNVAQILQNFLAKIKAITPAQRSQYIQTLEGILTVVEKIDPQLAPVLDSIILVLKMFDQPQPAPVTPPAA